MSRATWLAMGAIAGGLLAAQAGAPPLLVAGAGVAMVVGAASIRRDQRVAAAALACALVLARAAVGGAFTPTTEATSIDAGAAESGWEHDAVVLSVNAPSAGTQRAVLELRPPETPDRVFATLPRYPQIAPGDLVRFGGALEPAPDDDGFGAFLTRSGIGYTTRAREMERQGADGSPVAALEQLRRGAASMIAVGLPQPEAGLAAAMSIGLRDLVSRDVTTDFRVSGLSHVVAISGWHIAMLGALVSAMLGGIGRRPRSLLVLAAIGSYALFAGASPSVLRAAVMASVVLLARESGRRGSAAAGLSLTVAGMVVLEPATITDVGFQLSAAATAGLLVWGTRARLWFERWMPNRTPRWLVESLAVSTAAQVATLPLVLLHFGSLSLVAPLANLLIAPFVAPAMLLTAIAFVCGTLITLGMPAIALAPLALVGSLVIGATISIAHFCAGLPFATVTLASPVNLVCAAVCAAALLFSLRPGRARQHPAKTTDPRDRQTAPSAEGTGVHRRAKAAVSALVAVTVLLVSVGAARADGRLHITVLDVGQGDSILIEGPSGGRALVDGGPDPDRLIALLDARIPLWDRRIDLVVLTHPHEDHVAGLAAVLDRYRIGEVVEPGMVGPGPGDSAYRRRLAELGRESRIVAAGDTIALDGIRVDVRWPLRGTVPLRAPNSGAEINNIGLVLELRFGTRRILLVGDVEQEVDPQLLAAGTARDGQRLDVLKVAHHGSRTATTNSFVERARPLIAVVSVGSDNTYGHPSPDTLARLTNGGSSLFRTDLDGSVEISTNGTDLVATVSGGRPGGAPPWPTAPASTGLRRRRTYNRTDVDPIAGGSGPDPPRIGSAGLASKSLRGGRRRSRVPCGGHRVARARDQRWLGRSGGAAA